MVKFWLLNFQYMLWIFKFGSWNRHHLFKSPWLGHLKIYFHIKETLSQILFSIYHIYSLGLKGENEQIWLQTLRIFSLNSPNIIHTQITMSIQMSTNYNQNPLILLLTKAHWHYSWCDQTYRCKTVFWEQLCGSVDSLLVSVTLCILLQLSLSLWYTSNSFLVAELTHYLWKQTIP